MKGDVLRSLAAILVVIAVIAAPRSAHVIPAATVNGGPIGSGVSLVASGNPARSGAPTVRGASPLPSQPPAKPDELGPPRATTPAGPRPTANTAPKVRAAASPIATTGVAAWYADPRKAQGSIYAAAGPALRRALGPHWRGATVRVCSLHRCITTRLGDYCVCSPGTIIDLSWRAFSDPVIGLGVPLRRGIARVTVEAAR